MRKTTKLWSKEIKDLQKKSHILCSFLGTSENAGMKTLELSSWAWWERKSKEGDVICILGQLVAACSPAEPAPRLACPRERHPSPQVQAAAPLWSGSPSFWFPFARWLLRSRGGAQGLGNSEACQGKMNPLLVHSIRTRIYGQLGSYLVHCLKHSEWKQLPLLRLCVLQPNHSLCEISVKSMGHWRKRTCKPVSNIFWARTRVQIEARAPPLFESCKSS